MTAAARSTDPIAPVCAYHDDLMSTLRRVEEKQDQIFDRMATLDRGLSDHVARHLERERMEASGINWRRIQETFIMAIGVGLLTLVLLFALTHATEVLRFFGAG
jgi:hypothetical protein